jgi:hypothetical protein
LFVSAALFLVTRSFYETAFQKVRAALAPTLRRLVDTKWPRTAVLARLRLRLPGTVLLLLLLLLLLNELRPSTEPDDMLTGMLFKALDTPKDCLRR